MSIALELDDVYKTYVEGAHRVHAVRGVSLQLRAGEAVMLMGPSGSGKTTLLSLVGCLLRPSAGRVHVSGIDVTAWSEELLPYVRRTCIGFVFQQFNLLASLSARENVETALWLRGVRGAAARTLAGRTLDEVGLGHRAGFLPRDLSGGERQRVAIARALVAAPPVLLADEPTGSLDAANGALAIDLLCELCRLHGTALLVVTHDDRIVGRADRVVWMEDGRLRS